MSTSTVIVTRSVLLREGIASLLQNTPYKVVASAARPAELSSSRCSTGQRTLAIVGIRGNLDELAESIRVLRSLLLDGKVVLVAETDQCIDPQLVLGLSPDGCIFNLGSRDALIKVLELTLLDQRVFVFAKPIATTSEEKFTDVTRGLQPNGRNRLGNGHNQSPGNGHSLSPREIQILNSLSRGDSNKAIARSYNLSEATIKVHLKAILRKTNVHNRTQAAIWAIEHGFRDSSLEKANGHFECVDRLELPSAPGTRWLLSQCDHPSETTFSTVSWIIAVIRLTRRLNSA
jgi:two-component system, NarL family, nitrate/nitrite response regulator NarL